MSSSSAAAAATGGGNGGGARPWRTALLTLRDEALASPSPPALLALLRRLLLSSPTSPSALAAAASLLPPHEVTSDVVFLAETAAEVAASGCPVAGDALLGICRLIRDIFCGACVEINSSTWFAVLNFLEVTVERLLGGVTVKSCTGSAAMDTLAECLQVLRLVTTGYGRNSSFTEDAHLIRVLISIISCLQAELHMSEKFSGADIPACDLGMKNVRHPSLWDMELSAFSMIEDVLCKLGSTIMTELWQSVVEVLRKLMDFLVTRSLIIESGVMSRFYTTILHCLHLVLSDPKGSLSGHVAGFVAALQMFFMYGLRSSSSTAKTDSREIRSDSKSRNCNHGRYRPPHLRRSGGAKNHPLDAQGSDCEPSRYDFTSSDSDHSDNDGYAKNGDRFRSSKARLAAIVCVQDLCRADPKLLTTHWPLLLPENDVLQPRKYQPTLMTCLIFDPIIKVQIETASTIAAMLEGQALVLSQVAEYKESSKCGSFTTLSCSLGQILMQLHTGILYLIQRVTNTGLLMGLLRALILLISATPYARMPRELLPTVITAMSNRISESHSYKNERYGLLVNVLSCMEAAFSKMPPSLDVLRMLDQDASEGPLRSQHESSVVVVLLHCVGKEMHLSIRYEALQALRAMAHNYPSSVNRIWKQVSDIVLEFLQIQSFDDLRSDAAFGSSKVESSTKERCVMGGVKVMDECLRASSGFKGADDLIECRLLDIQQISDCTRKKKISSAPYFELEVPGTLHNCFLDTSSGIEHWIEVIDKHLPQALSHASPMVRTASITCFAGMTSAVFFSLPEDKRNFVISSSVSAAMSDAVPSVRSAACRAIGVVACFPPILSSSVVLNKFIDAVEFNTNNSLASVRTTASWALANICDSLRYKVSELHMEHLEGGLTNSTISLLVETALRLTKDTDKVKSNAVRALGNLSRFIRFKHHVDLVEGSSKSASCGDPTWLERMVQAFVSCVTTGNVKVQWNVCHALSNLFMNDTLKLPDMPWASNVYSILLLLLRDSNNYKIRMHAAVALAVPVSRLDYGSSFPDVVRGLGHILESLISNNTSSPSNFRHRDNLEKQLTFTTLHVLGLVSSKDDQSLKAYLFKKASFLEEWLKKLCSSLDIVEEQPSTSKASCAEKQDYGFSSYPSQKLMLSAAVKALLDIYSCNNNQTVAQKFEKLANSIS